MIGRIKALSSIIDADIGLFAQLKVILICHLCKSFLDKNEGIRARKSALLAGISSTEELLELLILLGLIGLVLNHGCGKVPESLSF